MKDGVVVFVGHRNEWQCLNLKDEIYKIFEQLIIEGYTTFYDGAHGAFDKLCMNVVCELKKKYPHIKLILISTHYKHNKLLPFCYSYSIFPPLECVYPKAKITERNKWMVDNCDIIVCHIENTSATSGAYRTIKYARKKNKNIIEI